MIAGQALGALWPTVIAVVLALAYLALGRTADTTRRLVTKAGSVLMIALGALVSGAPDLLVVALLFSAMGDAALVYAGRTAFLVGLAAFLMAHLLFGAAIITTFPLSAGAFSLWQIGLMSVLVVAGGALLALVWNGAAGMRLPAVAYALVILSMTCLAVMAGDMLLVGGAILFFLSDAVLSLETFRLAPQATIRRLTAPFVWLTYFGAQLLLAHSITAASMA